LRQGGPHLEFLRAAVSIIVFATVKRPPSRARTSGALRRDLAVALDGPKPLRS
jgi:hypothetical protein